MQNVPSTLRRALVMGAVVLAGMSSAMAGPGDQDPRPAPQPRYQEPPRERPEPRQIDPRALEEAQRRAQQERPQPQEGFRRNGRLTPDERRDLRRQINEAGQDIYANTPRR
ncbi:MAG TPA: hypothetical protein VFF16_06975 [Telluria sp.]|nr:hypothetical protein [Telluria sp.]